MSLESRRPYTPADLEKAKQVAQFGPVGGRELEQYADNLGLSLDDFEGKRVLDLGAGLQLKFATQLEAAGLNASVVSYSPFLAKDYLRGDALAIAPENVTSKAVGGMAEELPFADASFDRVVSLHMLNYATDVERKIKILDEICRVLIPGGTAYIGPSFKFRGQVSRLRAAIEKRGDATLEEAPWHNNPLDKQVLKISKH